MTWILAFLCVVAITLNKVMGIPAILSVMAAAILTGAAWVAIAMAFSYQLSGRLWPFQ